MKILQVGKFYSPALGGIETVVRQISEGLAARGHEVTVVCSDHTHRAQQKISEFVNGVQVVRLKAYGSALSQPLSLKLPAELKRLASRSHVLHLHSPNPLAEAAALWSALPSKVPTVLTYHADIVRQGYIIPSYRYFLRLLFSRVKRIVVATQTQLQLSSFLKGYEKKCEVIPIGLDPEGLKKTPALIARAGQIESQFGPYLLFVGRLVSYKGVHFLVQAMKKVLEHSPEYSLIVLGDGPELESLKALSKENGISQKVHFLGKIESNEERNAYYLGTRVFVLPSITRAEAFGVVMLEAMAFGKPVVSTRLDSGVQEVNIDQVTGFQVPPEDSEALAGAITRILRDPQLATQLGSAGKDHFLNQFTLEKMLDQYEVLYRNLCASY